MSLKYVKIEHRNEVDALFYKHFKSDCPDGYLEIGDEKCVLPQHYLTFMEAIENFEVKDTDIWITSYPKSGTTWTQEMVWMIVNNLDFGGGKQELHDRILFFEISCATDHRANIFKKIKSTPSPRSQNSVEFCKNSSHTPRIFKTHLSFSMLPKQIRNKSKKPKIIHVVRNPKDVCVSYYYLYRDLIGYTGSLEDFSKLFLAGRLMWGHFWNTCMSYWNRQEEYDILIIKYEDMKKDLSSVIVRVAEYLGKTLTTEQVSILKEHLGFENMKNNDSVNFNQIYMMARQANCDARFMRLGTVGSYKNDMSEEMIKKFEEWIAENMAGTGLSFGNV